MKAITISGAGLAGLCLANSLQRAGVPTTLHEALTLPRHRVCGEFICGKGAESLQRQGLDFAIEEARTHKSIRWYLKENCVLESILPSAAYGISRYLTDQRLADSYQALGGHLHYQSRLPNDPHEGLINCAGRQSTRSDWIGLKLHSLDIETRSDLELHLGEDGYLGMSGIEDGRTNICALFKLRPTIRSSKENLLFAYLRACGLEQLATRIEDSILDPKSHVGVAGITFSQLPKTQSPIATLGDAYSVIPPFTGNGMSIAIESAEIAAPIIKNYSNGNINWDKACLQIQKACHARFRRRLKVAQALHPWIMQASRQKILSLFCSAKILPFRLLYALTH